MVNISQVLQNKQKEVEMHDRLSQTGLPEFPFISFGKVLSYEPLTGLCDVLLYGMNQQVEAIVLGNINNVCGTPYGSKYDESYYVNREHGEGNKSYKQVTEGIKHTLEVDSLVVVIGSPNFTPMKDSYSVYFVVGTISFPQVEALFGPRRSASSDARIGEIDAQGAQRERVIPRKSDYHDEVGWTEHYRKEMAKDFDPNDNVPRECIPHMSPDVYWEMRRGARRKDIVDRSNGPYGSAGSTLQAFMNKWRFASRERFDAMRLAAKYLLNQTVQNEVETNEISEYTSELLIQLDNQGKIIIGAELEATLVECYCSDDNKYSPGDIDAGSFIVMGRAAGIQYVEISSKDWMFNRFQRGLTKFDKHWRVHGHEFGSDHRVLDFKTKTKDFVNESDLGSHTGVKYIEAEEMILDIGHLQITADRLLIDIDPAKIYWKNFNANGLVDIGL